MKKKPVFTYKNAHGGAEGQTTAAKEENWITAVASLHFSDLIASGELMYLVIALLFVFKPRDQDCP